MLTQVPGSGSPTFAGQPQEHFRSTGIRDTISGTPNVGKFDAVESSCIGSGIEWNRADIDCFTAFWDRNPGAGCSGPPSNDVNNDKKPAGCGPCDTAVSNSMCRSALQDTPEFLFEIFAEPKTAPLAYRKIPRNDFRKIWIDLDAPGQNGGGDAPPPPPPPPPSPSPPPCTGRFCLMASQLASFLQIP